MKPTPTTPDAPDFEEQARRLLERYAEGMPSETSVEARVREQLTAHAPQRHSAPRLAAPRWSLDGWARGAISLALVIVLVAGFAAVLRARQNTAPGKTGVSKTACPTVGSQGVITLCAGQQVQVTITLGQSYADATRTEVETNLKLTGDDLRLNGSRSLTPAFGALTDGMTLQDSQGRLYQMSDFNRNFGSYVQDMPSTEYGKTILPPPTPPPPGFAAFDPLPADMLGTPQRLTLRIPEIGLLYTLENGAQAILSVNGPWVLTFQVTPQAGHSITFNVAPQTYSGITVQPLRLDIGGAGSDFDYLGQGERLILRVSGLAPDTRRSTVANIDFKYFDKLGAGAAGGGSNANQLLFEGQLPASVAGMALQQSLALDPEVGPSGTVDLEVIFLRLPHLTGVQTLAISQLAVAFDGSQFTYVNGHWSFEVPLG
ncbi:MAG TPA: hypothetical protein VFU60_20295 [Ktedonobacterales bacterium]|nr:hypothetical protein [Ktedonobacterales bacterium]